MSFTYTDVQQRIKEQPFTPLRIVTTSGRSYDIYHPDLVLVGYTFVMVGMPRPELPEIVDHFNRIAVSHIAELTDLALATQPARGNVHD